MAQAGVNDVPLIDVSGWFSGDEAARDAVAHAFGRACEEWGFVLIRGHGVDAALTASVRETTRAFFDLPYEEKMKVSAAGRAGGRGYYGLKSKSHARTRGQADAPGDLRETFASGMEADPHDPHTLAPQAAGFFAPNAWPQSPAEMAVLWPRYRAECDRLARELMRISARALQLPDDWFDDKLDHAVGALFAQHYPAQDTPPVPGQVRSGEHTDFGTLTLLLAEDRPGGLQVQSLAGEWKDVRPVPGAYIVNLGDLMARWTNDRWRSTLHRVVNPPADAGAAARRLSIVYFHMPDHDAWIECIPSCTGPGHPPRYAPVQAGAHHLDKIRQTNSVQPSEPATPLAPVR